VIISLIAIVAGIIVMFGNARLAAAERPDRDLPAADHPDQRHRFLIRRF